MAAYVLGEASARFLRGLMRDRRPPAAAALSRRDGRPMAVQEDEFPVPFTVRWATSEGGWIIWLPSAECLMLGSAPVDVSAGLEAAESYPGGWYRLADIAGDAEAVYLNVTPPAAEDDETEVEFSPDPTYDENAWAILIATMSGKAVKQNVDSAIILDSGVRSLNGLSGHLTIEADPDASAVVGDSEIWAHVETDDESGTVRIGVTDQPPEEDDDNEGYCNNISFDGGDELLPSNDISRDTDGREIDGWGGGDLADNNAISRWPCRKN